MKVIKQQISEIETHTPRYVLWLLLSAAGVVVLILLTLLFTRDDKSQEDIQVQEAVAEIIPEINITPTVVDWAGTKIGQAVEQKFEITANTPVIINDIRTTKEIEGLSKPVTNCKHVGQINENVSCHIDIEFAPSASIEIQAVPIFVEWRGAKQPENMTSTSKITLSVGATMEKKIEPVVVPEPEPVFVPEPEPVFVPEIIEEEKIFLPEPESVVLPEPVVIEKEIRSIGATNLFAEPVDNFEYSETCDDFSFYGYNASGKSIGWIKPVRGTYKFYPFADKSCSNPTGIYNPDNGIITGISDPSIRIGTDAENIGFNIINNGVIPQLSNPVATRTVNRARQLTTEELATVKFGGSGRLDNIIMEEEDVSLLPSSYGSQATVNSMPYDRTFVLRQYKPIPATIVTEIQAVSNPTPLPVTATVDRNVYSDDGRTIIIPVGTMMLGSVEGDMPGPYKSVGRVNLEWYRFVRPDGVEFNFKGSRPFSGDAQGRVGVLGRGSTDYVEQLAMPMLTAMVPAAVNLIAPISDSFINQIDLDSNTVTQSGQIRSSELAKNEIITTWNQVAQKILTDMIDDSVPPFTIASGTRITVYSPTDLILTCGKGSGKKCSITEYNNAYAATEPREFTVGKDDPTTLVGQSRSFNMEQYCATDNDGNYTGEVAETPDDTDYRTVLFYCQSLQYEAINNAKQDAVYQNQVSTGLPQKGTQEYNEQVLGLEYNDSGTIKNPFESTSAPADSGGIKCPDGTSPNANGCCTGETYTDMGDQGFNCCPDTGGDCFPPIF